MPFIRGLPRSLHFAPGTQAHSLRASREDAPACPALAKRPRSQDLEPRSRPVNGSVTSLRPPSRPLSFAFSLSRFLSACLASSFVCLVLCCCVASSSAAAFLCCARPSSFLASSPVKAPQASLALPENLSSTTTPFLRLPAAVRS